MSIEKELATKACDGMEFVCSDLQSLSSKLIENNPIAAEHLQGVLREAVELKQKLSFVYGVIK